MQKPSFAKPQTGRHNYRDLLYGVILGVTLVFVARFIYWNVVVPFPYRHELEACLEEARSLSTESEIDAAENICFRTYPHFN